jgi:hypothetical protein
MTLLDEIAALTVPDLASRCGLAPGTCPACRASTRSERDRRPPVLVTQDGGGWRCLRCGAGGGAVDYLMATAPGLSVKDAIDAVLGREFWRATLAHDDFGLPLEWWEPIRPRGSVPAAWWTVTRWKRRDDVRRPWLAALRRVAADAERTGDLAVGLALEAWAAGCDGDWALDTAREYLAAGGEVVAVARRFGVDLPEDARC